MITISFITANYVARQLDFHMTEGWMQGDAATQAHFRPLETFETRFGEMLADIQHLGFDAISLWLAHLHPIWATPEHIAASHAQLDHYHLRVTGLAGGFGATHDEFEASCRLARALDAPILEGNTPLLASERNYVVKTLQQHGLKLGIENHAEKTPQELLARIGDSGMGHIGAALDTGWFGTQGYNAAQAIEELREYLFSVHLKDVRAPHAHDSCRFGEGCVPIEQCVRVLQQTNYTGTLSIEHEPEYFDPGADIRANLEMLQIWLGEEA